MADSLLFNAGLLSSPGSCWFSTVWGLQEKIKELILCNRVLFFSVNIGKSAGS